MLCASPSDRLPVALELPVPPPGEHRNLPVSSSTGTLHHIRTTDELHYPEVAYLWHRPEYCTVMDRLSVLTSASVIIICVEESTSNQMDRTRHFDSDATIMTLCRQILPDFHQITRCGDILIVFLDDTSEYLATFYATELETRLRQTSLGLPDVRVKSVKAPDISRSLDVAIHQTFRQAGASTTEVGSC